MARWDLSKLPEGRKPLPDEWFAERAQMQERIEELEAKLAKAVEAMREAIRLSEQPHYGDRGDALDHCFDAINVLRTTIEKLTGGKDE